MDETQILRFGFKVVPVAIHGCAVNLLLDNEEVKKIRRLTQNPRVTLYNVVYVYT